jgi:hypothetical protein
MKERTWNVKWNITLWCIKGSGEMRTANHSLFCKHLLYIASRIIKFYIFLTVHLRIILVGNQLDAQFLLWYVYLNPLHVLSNYVLILWRTIVLI